MINQFKYFILITKYIYLYSSKLYRILFKNINNNPFQKKHLSNLEKKHDDLDKVIERANFEKINPNVEKEREKLIDSSETEIYCVTCGQICSEKHALKHMEKCFNKVENFYYLFLTRLIFNSPQSFTCLKRSRLVFR